MTATTDLVPTTYAHPAWCSQGANCDPPRVCTDGTVEWDHARMTVVAGEDFTSDVFLIRMDAILPDGRHDVHERVVLTSADGSMTAGQAERLALALLDAARHLAAGLDGTPGGDR